MKIDFHFSIFIEEVKNRFINNGRKKLIKSYVIYIKKKLILHVYRNNK